MQIDLDKIFYKGIDYKTLELEKANYTLLENLYYVNPLYIGKKIFTPIGNINCVMTKTYIIIKTKEWGLDSGFNIYSIYLKNYRKVGQIKQYKKPDISHKNVLEMRGLACHFYGKTTQEILNIIDIESEWNLRGLHLDYCIDLLDYSVEDILFFFDSSTYKNVDKHETYGTINSVSIDIGDSRIRIYNKIQEIVENKQDKEYKEYIKLNRNVTRIEVAYKSTRSWSTRTYGAIIKRIEGIFGDTLSEKLNITNFYASVKKKLNVIIEKSEDIVIQGLDIINSNVEIVKEKLKQNIKRAKKTLENIKYLLGCDTYDELKKDYSYCEYDSITEDIEGLLSVIYN